MKKHDAVVILIYDLFYFHARNSTPIYATDRSMYVVRELMALLESGRSKKYRKVSYYAEQLNITVKYLSNTVKRQTGKSVTYFIDRYTVPMIKESSQKEFMPNLCRPAKVLEIWLNLFR